MEKKLLQLLLNHKFFSDNRRRLVRTMFPDQFELIYDLICEAHDKYQRDLTPEELRQLVRVKFPVMTQAQLNAVHECITDVGDANEQIGEDVAADVVSSMWRMEIGRQIAQEGIALAEGKSKGLDKLNRLIEASTEGFVPKDDIQLVPTDFDAVVKALEDTKRWKFNIPTLAMSVPGLAAGDFAVAFARPEIGKTAFHVSLTFGPEGFLSQGAKVLLLANEESAIRTVTRGIISATGIPQDKLASAGADKKRAWESLRSRLRVSDEPSVTPTRLEEMLKRFGADILLIDQIDKMAIEGSYAREDQEMGAIYVAVRDLAKKYNCAVLGICQASAEAENKTKVTYNMMAKSKTDKAAELDLAIGIGALPLTENKPPSRIRYLTISKNKINGFHGTVNCMLDQELHRYVV